MAKAKDIAALAGLAGLAYAMRKDKDKPVSNAYASSSNMTPIKGVGDATNDRMSNEDYIKSRMKTAPADAESSMQSNMLKAITSPKAAPNDQAGNQGVLSPKSLTPESKPKTKPRGVTSAQNTSSAKANQASADSRNVNYGNEGNRVVGEKSTPAMLPGSDPFEIFRSGKLHPRTGRPMKKGGAVKMASGGMTASRRGDGIATKGKTRGKIC